MGWLNYYNLLQKYDGNLALAKPSELRLAAICNPNTPTEALKIAKEKYRIWLARLAAEKISQQELLIKK